MPRSAEGGILRFLLEARRSKRRPRIPKQLTPRLIERRYLRDLREILSQMQELIERDVIDVLATRLDEERDDRTPTLVETLIGGVRLVFFERLEQRAESLAEGVASEVERFNRDQMNRQFQRVVKVDLFTSDGVAEAAEAFTAENVALIKSIPERFFSEIETGILRNIRQGIRANDTAAFIRERYRVSQNRATLIARDQVNKFNGELTRTRQERVGVTSYVWRTSLDERVRTAHRELEGEVFDWDRGGKHGLPPEGHPGFAVLCRCTAEPNIDELLDD